MYFYTNQLRLPSASLVSRFCWSRGLLSALASSKSQEMKAMRLTRNDHHRKLKALIRDISD
jgi:hypothetical protein